jgi:hypothetical protein
MAEAIAIAEAVDEDRCQRLAFALHGLAFESFFETLEWSELIQEIPNTFSVVVSALRSQLSNLSPELLHVSNECGCVPNRRPDDRRTASRTWRLLLFELLHPRANFLGCVPNRRPDDRRTARRAWRLLLFETARQTWRLLLFEVTSYRSRVLEPDDFRRLGRHRQP